jgi:hypothetical protein
MSSYNTNIVPVKTFSCICLPACLCLPAVLDKLRSNLVAMKKAHSSEEDKWVVWTLVPGERQHVFSRQRMMYCTARSAVEHWQSIMSCSAPGHVLLTSLICPRWKTAAGTLIKYIGNVVANPGEEKYRQVQTAFTPELPQHTQSCLNTICCMLLHLQAWLKTKL